MNQSIFLQIWFHPNPFIIFSTEIIFQEFRSDCLLLHPGILYWLLDVFMIWTPLPTPPALNQLCYLSSFHNCLSLLLTSLVSLITCLLPWMLLKLLVIFWLGLTFLWPHAFVQIVSLLPQMVFTTGLPSLPWCLLSQLLLQELTLEQHGFRLVQVLLYTDIIFQIVNTEVLHSPGWLNLKLRNPWSEGAMGLRDQR